MSLIDSLSNDLYRAQTTRGIVAQVTAVAGSTVTVDVAGSSVPEIPVAASYLAPAVDDVCLILKIGSAWVAVTALGVPGSTPGVAWADVSGKPMGRSWSSHSNFMTGAFALAWNNYADHQIIDASNSTAPGGASIDPSNASVGWTAGYPSLMGWNGSQTYGLRVDSARRADSASIADYVGNDAYNMRFHWSGQGGQPTWLWGSNDGSNIYVYNPANFSVNYATRSDYNYGRFYFQDTGGGTNYGSAYAWAGGGGRSLVISSWSAGAIRFDVGYLRFVNGNSLGTYITCAAAGFTVGSSKHDKEIHDDPTWRAKDVIRNAPAKKYRYRPEVAETRSDLLGPMAEDLPPELVDSESDAGDHTNNNGLQVNLVNLIGVLWKANEELQADLDDLRAEIDALKKKSDAPTHGKADKPGPTTPTS